MTRPGTLNTPDSGSMAQHTAVIEVGLPEAVIERIAQRAAEIVSARRLTGREEWVDVPGVTQYLACKPGRIYALVAAGRIPHRRDGSRLLFRLSEIDEWLATGGGKRP